MAIVYGEIDSLEKLIVLLKRSGVTHLNSLDEIMSYKDFCEEKVKEAEIGAREEHNNLLELQREKISNLLLKRETKLFKVLLLHLRLFCMRRRLKKLEENEERLIQENVILNTGSFYSSKALFDENYSLILGAQGEERALNELRKLPDSYRVINNFELRLTKPIYNKMTGERIFSAQADHIVVGPSGVYLIETKNWSKFTLENSTDFTPIDQVKRTSYALFCYLNRRNKGFLSKFLKPKKISIRSVLLMTGATTDERVPFVKVLNISQLNRYITRFSSVLTDKEIERIIDKLVR